MVIHHFNLLYPLFTCKHLNKQYFLLVTKYNQNFLNLQKLNHIFNQILHQIVLFNAQVIFFILLT